MSKYLWVLVVIFLFASCADSPMISISSQHGSETEEYAVYDTLIKQRYVRDQVEQIVIKDQTSLDNFNDDELERILQQVTLKLIALQKTTFNDFQAKNKEPHRLDESFNLSVNYVLISKAEEDELLYQRADGWVAFYKKYPKSQGVMTLSRVGFNPEMNQALVYVGNQSGPKTGAGYYMLLARENGNWVIKDRYGAWLS
jgi:phage pi2 protein 07